MATLAIEGMKFYAFHGVYDEERKAGGYYSVDVFATIDDRSGEHDLLDTTLNYEGVYSITKKVMEVPGKLIEYLAHEILKALKEEFAEAIKFKVKVIKHRPPLPGEVESTWFEIEG